MTEPRTEAVRVFVGAAPVEVLVRGEWALVIAVRINESAGTAVLVRLRQEMGRFDWYYLVDDVRPAEPVAPDKEGNG